MIDLSVIVSISASQCDLPNLIVMISASQCGLPDLIVTISASQCDRSQCDRSKVCFPICTTAAKGTSLRWFTTDTLKVLGRSGKDHSSGKLRRSADCNSSCALRFKDSQREYEKIESSKKADSRFGRNGKIQYENGTGFTKFFDYRVAVHAYSNFGTFVTDRMRA